MIGLLQRVSAAEVWVAQRRVAQIGRGLLVLVGIERGDGVAEAERLLTRLLAYRVFGDAGGKMNLAVREVAGGLLLVPQFTLAADTQTGTRPSFTPAALPEVAAPLFAHLVAQAQARHPQTACGIFGADMQVHLINDGPVTFSLRVAPVVHGHCS